MLFRSPPLMENGPHEEAEVLEEDGDDDDELSSATSRSEELAEDDEDEEPLQKRLKRKNGDFASASASSPVKQADLENKDEASESSLGARRTSDLADPRTRAAKMIWMSPG